MNALVDERPCFSGEVFEGIPIFIKSFGQGNSVKNDRQYGCVGHLKTCEEKLKRIYKQTDQCG